MARYLVMLCMLACSDDPGSKEPAQPSGGGRDGSCISDSDCPEDQWCLHQRCSDRAPPLVVEPVELEALLSVTPATLDFGTVAVGERRMLSLTLTNDGEAIITLGDLRVVPDEFPFRIESLGYGPFWIRPGRSREIFVTYAPYANLHQEATLFIESQAPMLSVELIGN